MFIPSVRNHGKAWEVRISVDGMRCYACVNKIKQKIYKVFPNSSVEADYANKSFKIWFTDKPNNLDLLSKSISQLGFVPRPYFKKAFREELINLGVSGYAAGNVMLMSIAEYLGKVDAPFDRLFHYTCLLLSSFSFIFAAKPIWQSALKGLRNYKCEIDLGILLGITCAYIYSCFNVFRGFGEVYFDSITVVIFLILTGRFIRNRKLDLATKHLSESVAGDPEYAYVLKENGPQITPSSKLVAGDEILIRPGDMIPVESRVESGSGYIDFSSINGEGERKWVQAGSVLPSGAFSVDGAFHLKCCKSGDSGFFNRSQKVIDDLVHKKGLWQTRANVVATWFVLILVLSVLILILFQAGGNYQESIRRSMSLLLIACPCALGFGIPLALSKAIYELSNKGIVVQNVDALERVLQCHEVVFDKTGTLTKPDLELKQVKIHHHEHFALDLARSVGNYSQHHVPQALSKWANQTGEINKGIVKFESIKEVAGQGLILKNEHGVAKIGKPSFTGSAGTHSGDVHVSLNGDCIMSFHLGETLEAGAMPVLEFFRKRNKKSYILSGDIKSRTINIARKLGIPETNILSQQSPDDKLNFTLGKNFFMIGNGLNDMMAFSASKVSIAVKGSQPLARRKADFFLNQTDIIGVIDIYKIGEQLQRVLLRLYRFSFAYNLCTLIAAASGYVNPLVAAILMPLSSLWTINLATIWPKGR